MSDEPTPTDQPDGWVMPEPVFRTSKGRDPRAAKDEVDGAGVAVPNTDDIDTDSPDAEESGPVEEQSHAGDKPANTVRAATAKKTKQKRGCAKNFLLIVSVIFFSVVAIIIAAVYFLFYYRLPDNGTF